MNSNIKVFENAELGSVRTTVDEKGEPLFCARDVCKALGYVNPRTALRSHVENVDVQNLYIDDSRGHKNRFSFINESGLYALILGSKLPQAKDFKHWVTAEVLPQIRKTGEYILLEKDELIEQKDNELRAKNMVILAQQPAVQFAAAVTACDDSILIRDLAKLLTQNGVKIGQTRMFHWLRQNGYIFQHETRPIQEWVERGIFTLNEKLMHLYGGTKFRLTTRVTGKGQKYFINGFLNGKFMA